MLYFCDFINKIDPLPFFFLYNILFKTVPNCIESGEKRKHHEQIYHLICRRPRDFSEMFSTDVAVVLEASTSLE